MWALKNLRLPNWFMSAFWKEYQSLSSVRDVNPLESEECLVHANFVLIQVEEEEE